MKKIICVLLVLLLCGGALAETTANFETLTNPQLGITLQYPAGWVSNPGTSTICYLESMNSDTVAGRLAITVKAVSAAPTSEELEDQLTGLSSSIATMYTNFNITEMTTDGRFMNTRAYALRYTADSDKGQVSGFVTITHINKKLYAFHYSCAAENFDAMSGTVQALRDSVALIKGN